MFVAICGCITAKEIIPMMQLILLWQKKGPGLVKCVFDERWLGREDGGLRRTYHIHPLMSLATLCGKMVTEKNRMYLGSRGGRGRVHDR